jgi:hypothetical protein
MPEAEHDDQGARWNDWRQVAVVLVDFESRKVEIKFDDVEFYNRPIEEQASIATALLETALNEHVEAHDARVDALTPATEAAPAPEACFYVDGAAAAGSDL